jgi:PilZ domain
LSRNNLQQLTHSSQIPVAGLLRSSGSPHNKRRVISPIATEFLTKIRRLAQASQGEGDLHMPDVMADRRDAPRYPLILIAEVTEIASAIKVTARTSDVSRTGCYIDTLTPAPKGTHIRLRLMRGEETFETEARVVYVSPGLGMGIRFHEYAAEKQLVTLDRWLGAATNP